MGPTIVFYGESIPHHLTEIVCYRTSFDRRGGNDHRNSSQPDPGRAAVGTVLRPPPYPFCAMDDGRTAFRGRVYSLGWWYLTRVGSLLGVNEYVDNSTVAILSARVLFCTLVDWENREFLLDWEWARKIPGRF